MEYLFNKEIYFWSVFSLEILGGMPISGIPSLLLNKIVETNEYIGCKPRYPLKELYIAVHLKCWELKGSTRFGQPNDPAEKKVFSSSSLQISILR